MDCDTMDANTIKGFLAPYANKSKIINIHGLNKIGV
jgi:hypothetical protein